MEMKGMAYALFGEAVQNDMEIKFGGREALHQAVEEQRTAAIQNQVAAALAQGDEINAEVLSELSEDVRERLMRMVISRMWEDADPAEKQPFLDEEAKSAAPSEVPTADAATDPADDLDDDDDEDNEGSDTMIGVSRKNAVKRAQAVKPREVSPDDQQVAPSKDAERSKKKESSREMIEAPHRSKRLEKEGASRNSSSATGAKAKSSTQALVDTDGEEDEVAEKGGDEPTPKTPSVSTKSASKPASKRKSSGAAATESKRQAASGSNTRGKARESSSSKKKKRQLANSKTSHRGKGRGGSSGGKLESRGSDKELAEILSALGLKFGEKEWIQIEWAVQKTGKDADEWMQWFNASVDLRKPVGVDEDNRPKWPIHYSRCGTLAATKSKVSFVSRDQLLDDFDSEPMNWRMKQDDLQETVPQLKRSSSMAGSTSSSSANDREAEWRDDLGTKPRSRR